MRIAVLLSLLLTLFACAQSYPSRPLTMAVPAAPGGTAEGIARPFAEKLASVLGQPVVLENRPAAGAQLVFAENSVAGLTDLVPISKVGTAPTALAVYPAVPAKDYRELAALSQRKPLAFGTPGVGSVPQLAGELLRLEAAMPLTHVPYKDAEAAIAAALAGEIDMVIAPLPALAPQIEAGKLRGIAIVGPKPSRILPALPTLGEAGGPNVSADIWYGLFAPAGTPASVVQRLNRAAVEAIESPDLVARLRKAGYEPEWSRPEILAAQVKSDLAKWARVRPRRAPPASR